MVEIGTLNIKISDYKSSTHFKSLNQADEAEDTGEKGQTYNGVIDTDAERLKAAELVCGTKTTDVKQAEACLRKALNITAAAPVSGSGQGAQVKSVAPNWGKSGLKAKVDGGAAVIEGNLQDAELYTITLAASLSVKAGQFIVLEMEADGSFSWGGKVASFQGWPGLTVSGDGFVATDDPSEKTWVSGTGKTMVKLPVTRDKQVNVLSVKTGGMTDGYIKISNIRVE